MKIVDSLECPLCNSIPETFGHAFIECQKKHKLWRLVELWLGMLLKDDIKISDSERILGTTYKNPIIYTVILLTIKKKIYQHRQKGTLTNIAEIKYESSVQLQYEEYYAGIERKTSIFEQKWPDQIVGYNTE